ncbi:alpha/beta hydrolase [Pseudomaricurvus alkylphenolicus]|nr:alpha/beta hydrolase [Pseudomaricurvus alkylphenolicus]
MLLVGCLAASALAKGPQVSSGKLVVHRDFPSNYVASRDIMVWLPDGYSASNKYDVVYMHDGDALFDASTHWNGQEWGVDETSADLISRGKVRPFIVVGVPNGGALRHSEYFPQKPWESFSPQQRRELRQSKRQSGAAVFHAEVQSDNYLKFLVQEIKPFIDKHYSVNTGPAHTRVMGSSMGGLISIYALSEYPHIFGAAACLSSHWPGVFHVQGNPIPEAFYAYLERHLPAPGQHRIYFDFGTATLDALYPPLQARVDGIMAARGYSDAEWITRRFQGAEHTENAWRQRLDIPLRFLLGKDESL